MADLGSPVHINNNSISNVDVEFRDDTSVEPLVPDQTIDAINTIKKQCKKLKFKEILKQAKIDITIGEVNFKIQDLKISGQIN